MKEKLESLPVSALKEIAKSKGLKNISTLKKAELIKVLLDLFENEEKNSDEQKKEAVSRSSNIETVNSSQDSNTQNNSNTQNSGNVQNNNGNTQNSLDSGEVANGILEVMPEGYGFIRCDNYLPGEGDVYVSPMQIRRFTLRTGDIIVGNKKIKSPTEKFSALLYVKTINGMPLDKMQNRIAFEDMVPIFPDERLRLETEKEDRAMRILDLVSPIGKGQRGMIVSQPKAGKTTLLKSIAKSILKNNPEMHMIILLIDERPEEVTDINDSIVGNNV